MRDQCECRQLPVTGCQALPSTFLCFPGNWKLVTGNHNLLTRQL
jgi:hypothetical protein